MRMRKPYGFLALLLIVLLTSCGGGGGGGGVAVPPSTPTPAPAPPPATGSALLSWVTPTLNDDGTPLTNLAGFYVQYGTASGRYTTTILVSDPTATTYTVSNLTGGATYYFAVTAYTSAIPPVESIPSNEAHKKI